MDKKYREAIRNAYIGVMGQTIEALLNTYEVTHVERDTNEINGVLQSVCIVYTLRVPLSVGGFILVDVFEDSYLELGEMVYYEPIKGHTFCTLWFDCEGNPSLDL